MVCRSILCSMVLLFFAQLHGQLDTILIYDYNSKQTFTVGPAIVDSSSTQEKTSSFSGTRSGKAILPSVTPTANVFAGVNFTDLARAANYFELTDYPVRTTVALFVSSGTNTRRSCSGTLIGRDLVLVAGHCVLDNFYHGTSLHHDSVRVYPSWDNGQPHSLLPSSKAARVVYFHKTEAGQENDIAILQLENPIGDELGWLGFGFAAAPFFDQKLFHKFSYPGDAPSPIDSNRFFNGDTMYYNYGLVKADPPSSPPGWTTWLIVDSPEAIMIPGMSGSPLIYYDGADYVVYGFAMFDAKYRHVRLEREHFYPLSSLIQNNTLALPMNGVNKVKVYPNPFTANLTVQVSMPAAKSKLEVYSSEGRRINVRYTMHDGEIQLERGDLLPGLYFLKVISDQQTMFFRVVAQ